MWRHVARILACLIAPMCGASVRAEAAQWQAGVAKVAITPEEPTWLSGYSSRDRAAEGKVHDLFAKALAIRDAAGERLVIVTLDLGSVSEAEIAGPVARQVEETHGLPRGALVLNVSHTHCAPEVAIERRVFHALDDEEEAKLARYIGWLNERIVEVVGAALDGLAPASLTMANSSADFARNRRFPTPDGFVNQQYDEGVVDHDVPVLSVRSADGKLMAALFGYACHNTTLAFYQYCGDYAGFAQYDIEARHPGATALFMMGCGGDQNPYPRHGPEGLDHARRHGRSLADAVDRALAAPQQEIQGPLRVAYGVATLDLEPLPPREQLEADARGSSGHPQRKASYLLDRPDRDGTIELTQPCPVHVARFGDQLLLIAIGGETVVDYSLLCKREFGGPRVWVAGYCDDVFAYLPSLRVLREGGYEGRTGIVHQLVPTPFMPSVEDRVMAAVRRLVADVTPRQ